MPGDAAFLDVRSSLTESRWQAATPVFGHDELDRRAAAIAQTFPDMPLPVTRILAGRDLGELSVEQFLEPTRGVPAYLSEHHENVPENGLFEKLPEKLEDMWTECIEWMKDKKKQWKD